MGVLSQGCRIQHVLGIDAGGESEEAQETIKVRRVFSSFGCSRWCSEAAAPSESSCRFL